MTNSRRDLAIWTLGLWILTLLSSCGGGGDGGSNGGSSFSVSPTTITFTATQGDSPPAPQNATVAVQSGSVFISTAASGTGFSHSFQITGTTTGIVTVTPDAPVTAGTFTGTITVTGCADVACATNQVAGSPQIITVTYTVNPAPSLTSTPPAVSFVTSTGSLPSSQSINLETNAGSVPWTVGAPVYTAGAPDWLNVTPTTGTLNPSQTVTFNVTNASGAEVRTATVTFTAGTRTRTVPVTLTINNARTNFVAPYVIPAASAGNVIIRGFGFAGLQASSLQVLFGTTPATNASIISDTEIHAEHPLLAAGSYTVTVGDGAVTLPSRSALKLVVVSPTPLPVATIARTNDPKTPGNLIYDGERQALYLMDADNRRIERYRLSAGSWSMDSTATAGSGAGINIRMALSPDGTELLQTLATGMFRWNPATLTLIGSVDSSGFLGSGGALNMIAIGNDGGAIGNSISPLLNITLYRYDMLTQRFAALSSQQDMTNRSIAASANGDLLVLPSHEPLAIGFEKPVSIYDTSGTGALIQTGASTSGTEHPSVSRDGSRMILSSSEPFPTQIATVYGRNSGAITALGALPAGSGAGITGYVISPDGSVAYAYYSDTSSIRKFDLNSPTGGGSFTEVGSVVVASPGTFYNSMAITPDGGTLFLAGNQQVIVVPAP